MHALAALSWLACGRHPSPVPSGPSAASATSSRAAPGVPPFPPPAERAVGAPRVDASPPDAGPVAPRASAAVRRVSFGDDDRAAFVVLPRVAQSPPRLLAAIHGVCTPPSYVCGAWQDAAADVGLLVCPAGNATCGPEGTGAPTWEGPFSGIDVDLERSVDAVRRKLAPSLSHDGAVLMGYSRGGYAAVVTAVRHPGRWPFLIVNEADVDLTVPMLRAAGVRAVALIAGEWGTQLAGERRTATSLAAEGYPARMWVMGQTGHPYSTDIDAIMAEALAFVLSQEAAPKAPPER